MQSSSDMDHDQGVEDPTDSPGDARTASAQPGHQQPPPPRRLERSQERKIAGVAGGIAEYFNIDPVIIRLGFVVALFAGGVGLVGYLIAWVVLPSSSEPPGQSHGGGVDRSTALAVTLLVIAAIVGVADAFDGGVLTALVLVAAGVFILHQRPMDEAPASSQTSPDASPGPTTFRGYDSPTPPPAPPPAPPRPERKPALVTRTAASVVAIIAAIAIGIDALNWVNGIDPSTVMAIGLVVVGVASVVAAFVGRGRGLTPLGILLALGFVAASAIEPVVEDGVGERDYTVTELNDLDTEYRLGIGELTVDLRELEIPDGTTVEVAVDLGIGEAVVHVPDDVDLTLTSDVTMGEAVILGEFENGIRNEITVERDQPGDARLVIDLEVGIGTGRIER